MRSKSGYTQKQVADMLGLDRSTYSYYELGKIKPDIATIMKLANIFDVHYTDILESEEHSSFSDSFRGDRKSLINKTNEKMTFERVTQEEKEFLIAFRNLSKGDRKETLEFMDLKTRI